MVRGDNKARGTSQLGSLPLFLSLFLLLLAFFIFLNSISTRQSGKSDDVLDSVRASFASVLQGGTGTGVFEGEPGKNADTGLRDELREAFAPLLAVTWLRDARDGNPLYMDFEGDRLFRRGNIDPVLEFRDFAARVSPVLVREAERNNAEIRFWSAYPESEAARDLLQQRLARMAEILIATGAPRSDVSIGFRRLPSDGTIRISVDVGSERPR